jgi:hypothetical protein
MTRKKPDADTRAVWQALKLAAKDARKLAEETGTPFYVVQRGKIVNLNPSKRRRAKVRDARTLTHQSSRQSRTA